MNAQQIEVTLKGFNNGTNDYHQSSAFMHNFYHTDGIQYLVKEARSFWLLDAIVSHQGYNKVKKEPFQVWTLKVENKKAVLTCGDGNDTPPLVTQKIPYTDFPLSEITLYVEDISLDGEHLAKILMLPQER